MDLKHVITTLTIVCFLGDIDTALSFCFRPKHITLQSYYQKKSSCSGGNLLKIHINPQCKVTNGQCKAICNAKSDTDPNTKFTTKKIRGKKCIQFTEQGGTKYALKVIGGTSVAFKKAQCDSSISHEFLFDEGIRRANGKFHIYSHTVNSKTMYLGVTGNCNDKTLTLISTNGDDRRCFFERTCY